MLLCVKTPLVAFTSKLFHLVKIDMVKETHILRVLMRHESPDVAAEMANLYARSYTDYVSVQDAEMTEKAREFLTRQAEELRQRVVASEKRLLEYRQAEGLATDADTAFSIHISDNRQESIAMTSNALNTNTHRIASQSNGSLCGQTQNPPCPQCKVHQWQQQSR